MPFYKKVDVEVRQVDDDEEVDVNGESLIARRGTWVITSTRDGRVSLWSDKAFGRWFVELPD